MSFYKNYSPSKFIFRAVSLTELGVFFLQQWEYAKYQVAAFRRENSESFTFPSRIPFLFYSFEVRLAGRNYTPLAGKLLFNIPGVATGILNAAFTCFFLFLYD